MQHGLPANTRPADWLAAHEARTARASALALALVAARERRLALAATYEAALGPGLRTPDWPELNPPLWELGHVGWFLDPHDAPLVFMALAWLARAVRAGSWLFIRACSRCPRPIRFSARWWRWWTARVLFRAAS